MTDRAESLTIRWSPIYRPEWDDTPEEYVVQGVVAWGRSRRLARTEDAARRFKAYLGVQHFDPARYGLAGEAQAKFFVSLFVGGHTAALHTYPTLRQTREDLERFHAALEERHPLAPSPRGRGDAGVATTPQEDKISGSSSLRRERGWG